MTTEQPDIAEASADVRRNFAVRHLNAVGHFVGQLREHEAANVGTGFGPHFDLSSTLANAALVLAFSAIEAATDEAEDDLALPMPLTAVLERAPTLDRVQAILAHRGATCFAKGEEPFQSADLLRALRNGLVHPKAEWDSVAENNRKLSKRIVSQGLGLSPFLPDPTLAFPMGCMSASVAEWALVTACRFIAETRDRLQLPLLALPR